MSLRDRIAKTGKPTAPASPLRDRIAKSRPRPAVQPEPTEDRSADQVTCAYKYCLNSVPRPVDGHGWHHVSGLLWCPSHYVNPTAKVAEHADETDFHQGRTREAVGRAREAREDHAHALEWAKTNGIGRKDPALQRRLAELDARAERFEKLAAGHQRELAAAYARHQEHEKALAKSWERKGDIKPDARQE